MKEDNDSDDSMNPITKLFTEMSNVDLLKAIEEIVELENTGILCDGIVREYDRKCREITHEASVNLFIINNNIMWEAAHRWYEENEGAYDRASSANSEKEALESLGGAR